MITIIDSGGANISSIQFALARLGAQTQLSHEADIIRQSSHVILPGVGSAGSAMKRLNDYSLAQLICSLTQPVLGICLGMQLLFEFSEEDNVDCLGLIPGRIKKLPDAEKLIVPHMGWNKINLMVENYLLKHVENGSYTYFVHSYMAQLSTYSLASTCHGLTFSSVVRNKNFYGTQFHPERSGDIGAQILKNFLEL